MNAPIPVEACNATVRADELPPTQMVWVEVGWVVRAGSGVITTAAVLDVMTEHPPPVREIMA